MMADIRLRGLAASSFVAVCACSFALLTGCGESDPEPTLPAGSIAAAYSDYAAENASPVTAAFTDALKKPMLALKQALTNADPKADVAAFDADACQNFFGFKQSECRWGLIAVGDVTRAAAGQKVRFPDISFAIGVTAFDPDKTAAAVTHYFAEKKTAGKVEPFDLSGRKAWRLVHKDLNLVDNLAPCLTFRGNKLILLASNEKMLRELVALYDGKAKPLAASHPLQKVLELKPQVVSQCMVGDVDQLVSRLMSDKERQSLDMIPQLGIAVKALRSLAFDVRLIPDTDSTCITLRLGCANESDAQSVSEMLITLKTSVKMLMAVSQKSRPELALLGEVWDRVKVSANASEASIAFTLKANDFRNLDLAAFLQAVPKK